MRMRSPIPFLLCIIIFICETRQTTAEEAAVRQDLDVPVVSQKNHEKRLTTVTLVFQKERNSEPIAMFSSALRKAVAGAMNKRRQSSAVQDLQANLTRMEEWRKDGEISEDGVFIVRFSSIPGHSKIRTEIFARDSGGQLISADDVTEAIIKEQKWISHKVGLRLVSVSSGQSKKIRKPRAEATTITQSNEVEERPRSIWEAHRWIFIAILIFIGVSILLAFICCICLRCRSKSSARDKSKEVIKEEPNVVVSSTGPMQEQSPPNDPLPLDEENGWIIPLDQMTKEELEQPEVQVSRL